jgi:hypothetical protein
MTSNGASQSYHIFIQRSMIVTLVLKPVSGKVAKSMLNYYKIDIQKILDIKLVDQFDKYLH